MTRWDAIMAAVVLALSGQEDEAREALTACWEAAAETDHAQRCVIAHYLADVQASVEDEGGWDEAALNAHAHVRDEDLAPIGVPSAAGFGPSLHLNLADGYLHLGRIEDAREQLHLGVQGQNLLPVAGYGALIRGGLQRLAQRLDDA